MTDDMTTITDDITPGGSPCLRTYDRDGRRWTAILTGKHVAMCVVPTEAEQARNDWATRTEDLPYEGEQLWGQFAGLDYDTAERGRELACRALEIAVAHVAAL